MIDRRQFLRRTGAASVPLLTGLPGLQAGTSFLTNLLPPDSDRVLVLVQLNGGNDGLNTLIPTDQMGALRSVRPNVGQAASGLKAITNRLSFHSRMEGFQQLYNEGKMSIIQDVGYPNQNRSHFRSTDIWSTASDAVTELETGWLGRHLEVQYTDYPAGFPNADLPHPPAISMGNVANATCEGLVTNLSQTVNNPTSLTFLAPGGNTPLPDDNYGDELGFLRVAIEQTNTYGTVIRDAAEGGNSTAEYPDDRLGNQLRNVVRLISGGLQTQVYVVQHNGFDTHSGQVDGGDAAGGRHGDLVEVLSQSLKAFQEDLEAEGLAGRVMGMTFSEFGRRIRDNASSGTDHGTAAPMFLFGGCVSGTILGDNTNIDVEVDQNEGVPMQYDFRDVYGSVLVDWFEVPEADVRTLLYPGFVYLPVANGCASNLPVDLMDFTASGNTKSIQLKWQTAKETNNEGFDIERSEDGRTFQRIAKRAAGSADKAGVRSYDLEDLDVTPGPLYYYRLKQKDFDGGFEYSPVKTARLTGAARGDWSIGHAFPNPASNETTFQAYAPTDSRLTYTIFNQSGQRILNDTLSVYGQRDNRFTIGLGRVPAGNYTVRFELPKGKYETRKLIVI